VACVWGAISGRAPGAKPYTHRMEPLVRRGDGRIMSAGRACCAGLALVLAAGLSGCGGREPVINEDPAIAAADPKLEVSTRVLAVERMWEEGAGDPAIRRESAKTILWQASNPVQVRRKALELILTDPSDPELKDARQMVGFMLPVEPNIEMVRTLSELAANRGWIELTGPMVRSWARFMGGGQDADRPERAAIAKLHPNQPMRDVLFELFAKPATGEGRERERQERTRNAAWALLSREDPDGSARRELLARLPAAGDPLVDDLRASALGPKTIPVTASQLEWLRRMRDFDNPTTGKAAQQWWAESTAAVAGLGGERAEGLSLRHIEPIRWATANKPEWIAADRASLIEQLRQRLRGRPSHGRGGDDAERLAARESKMNWADVLTVLVIDEALRSPGVAAALWEQSERDRLDTSTEYGGLLAPRTGGSGGFVAAGYPPRATQRFGDTRFVASDDLLRDAARALAHYHFHSQKIDNRDYAGPGPGDAEYAREHGAACVVFTPVGPNKLDATYFHTGGFVLDLGELNAGGK
jgi:hypothetical protein